MGFRGRHKNKRDANEPEIVETLEKYGFTVVRLDTPADLLAGIGGRTYLIEVKDRKGRLTAAQSDFYAAWRGNVTILRDVYEAETFARHARKLG